LRTGVGCAGSGFFERFVTIVAPFQAGGTQGITGEQIAFWESVLAEATATAEWKSELAKHFWTEMHLDGRALRAYLKNERIEMRSVLGELGLLSR
jgi:tripartite-type tricarboxylate transporter receptor subunit TctC